MNTAHDEFPVRLFAMVVLAGAGALVGLGAIAVRCLDHPHPIRRAVAPAIASTPCRVEAPSAPQLAEASAPARAEPARRKPRPHTPAQTTKPPSIGLSVEDCHGDPICGLNLGK
jgi:hypothetical protein